MNNDQEPRIDALMARIELHFARQSEVVEATTARMQKGLERVKEMERRNKEMGDVLDKLERDV